MRAVVVDDHPLIQEAVSNVLRRLDASVDIDVAGDCETGIEIASRAQSIEQDTSGYRCGQAGNGSTTAKRRALKLCMRASFYAVGPSLLERDFSKRFEAHGPRAPRRTGSVLIGARAISAAVALSAALLAFATHAAGASTPEGVLIIHSNQRITPAGVVIENTLRTVVPEGMQRPVELFSEYLDMEWASTEASAAAQAEFLRQKYNGRDIRVIVASAPQALQFVAKYRDRMLPGVPVVHLAMPKDQLERTSFPPDIIGKSVDLDPTSTLALAVRMHPDAKRLVIVLGAAERDRVWEQRLRKAVVQLGERVEVEYLRGLPTADVARRLGALPKDTIVYTPGYFVDGTGEVRTPRQSLEIIAPASAAPMYGPLDTFLGTGIVGGYMTPYEDQSREAGAMVVRLLNGTPPAAIPSSSVATVPMVDWRAVRRFGIDEHLLPTDTIVKFREPTAWDKYWREISLGIAILLLQFGLIAALLIERRLRRIAESESQKRFAEMAHMNRRVSMGELSASIAHELNQPLGAIRNNAGAAEMLIKADPPKLQEVAEILADIRRDDQRASDVIARIRRMMRKTQFEVQDIDLNETIGEAIQMVTANATVKGVSLKVELEPGLSKVRADRVEVQQVMLNLVLNAIEAMHDQHAKGRELAIRSRRANGKEALVSVADSGPGIPGEILSRIFEPFVTSKTKGMGLGLAISRTIVEAHGGQIRAENPPAGGAVFLFTLPFA